MKSYEVGSLVKYSKRTGIGKKKSRNALAQPSCYEPYHKQDSCGALGARQQGVTGWESTGKHETRCIPCFPLHST
jgi:hypothetical protein